jgi:hypothetical protein
VTACVASAAQAAERAGLIVHEDGALAFRHALVAAAIVDDLLPPERARLCLLAANATRQAHPDADEPWAVLAADLFARAGVTALADTARVWQATVAAYRGRAREVTQLLAGITERHALDIEVAEWGLCRAMLALVLEERAAALAAFAKADELARRLVPLLGNVAGGPRLLLELVDGTAQGPVTVAEPASFHVRWDRMHSGFCAAVLAGREGRTADAQAALAVAQDAATVYALHGPLYLRLVAEACWPANITAIAGGRPSR